MKHKARASSGFQTHSDRCKFGTETVRGVCVLGGYCRYGVVAGRISQIPTGAGRVQILRMGAGVDKKFQLAQDCTSGMAPLFHLLLRQITSRHTGAGFDEGSANFLSKKSDFT